MKIKVVLLSILASLSVFACDKADDSKSTKSVPVKVEAETVEAKPQDNIVVYSSRKEHLIKPFFEEFTANTDIQIDYITDKAGPLVTRLKAEGDRTEADIFMTVDAGNLWLAKKEGILQAIDSQTLEANIPEHLQDPENYWYGLTVRARTMVYDTNKIKPEELSSYEDLADPKWQGRLCLRTSKKIYNQSLVAMLIARHGLLKAEQIVKGWVANLATAPFSNDTKVMKAIEAGQCEVGIVNSYYFARLQKENPEIDLALYLPADSEKGVHVNISGAAITKHADNPDGALQLIEWLSSSAAQKMYAGLNMEYPANQSVDLVQQVAAWGEFKADDMNLSKAGELQPAAVQLMDRVGYK